MNEERSAQPNIESCSERQPGRDFSSQDIPAELDSEHRRNGGRDFIYRGLIGLASGGLCGAVLGGFCGLVLGGGIESWNDRGTIMGGSVGENSITFTQALTLYFWIFGGLIGGFLGFLIGAITTRRKRDIIQH